MLRVNSPTKGLASWSINGMHAQVKLVVFLKSCCAGIDSPYHSP